MEQVKANVGFIGLGKMGFGVANNLFEAGYPLYVNDAFKENAQPLLDKGAHWCESAKEILQHCNVLITMVRNQFDVEQLYLAPDGIVDNLKEGMLVIDLTSSTPAMAERVSEAVAKKKAYAIDAPVTGGKKGADDGSLFLMCGGTEEAFEKAQEYLQYVSSKTVLMGGPGKGQHTKACNQICAIASYYAIVEAMKYAKEAGLDLDKVLEIVPKNDHQKRVGRLIADGNMDNTFFVKHILKDLRIICSEVERMGFDLPITELAEKLYEHAIELGNEFEGGQCLIRVYDEKK